MPVNSAPEGPAPLPDLLVGRVRQRAVGRGGGQEPMRAVQAGLTLQPPNEGLDKGLPHAGVHGGGDEPLPTQRGCACRGDTGLAHVACQAQAARTRARAGTKRG